jgi:hypothetical protein
VFYGADEFKEIRRFIEVLDGFENFSKVAVIFCQCRLTKVFIAVLCAFGLGNGRDS